MPEVVTIHGRFPWLVHRQSPDRRWIGVCDPLNLAMEADTLDELYGVINEAVTLLMHDLLVDNELEQFFRQRGWQFSGLPTAANAQNVEFALPPMELIVQNMHGPERRAH